MRNSGQNPEKNSWKDVIRAYRYVDSINEPYRIEQFIAANQKAAPSELFYVLVQQDLETYWDPKERMRVASAKERIRFSDSIEVYVRTTKKNGQLGKAKALKPRQIETMMRTVKALDREILQSVGLLNEDVIENMIYNTRYYGNDQIQFSLSENDRSQHIFEMLSKTGRFFLGESSYQPSDSFWEEIDLGEKKPLKLWASTSTNMRSPADETNSSLEVLNTNFLSENNHTGVGPADIHQNLTESSKATNDFSSFERGVYVHIVGDQTLTNPKDLASKGKKNVSESTQLKISAFLSDNPNGPLPIKEGEKTNTETAITKTTSPETSPLDLNSQHRESTPANPNLHWYFTKNLNHLIKVDENLAQIGGSKFFLFENTIIPLSNYRHARWINTVQRMHDENVSIPENEVDDFMAQLSHEKSTPPIWIDPKLDFSYESPEPTARLYLTYNQSTPHYLVAALRFKYQQFEVDSFENSAQIIDIKTRNLILRDAAFEKKCTHLMNAATDHGNDSWSWAIDSSILNKLVRQLGDFGWEIFLEQKKYRSMNTPKIKIQSSGIDWFDLEIEQTSHVEGVNFGIPEILKAVKDKSEFVELCDGSIAALDADFMEKVALLARLGKTQDNKIGFSASGAMIVDALLNEMKSVDCDRAFTSLREKIKKIGKVKQLSPPTSFKTELRPYQKTGLGWLDYMRTLGVGGCLADDMGLGKTVQVLAFLEKLKKEKKLTKPAIIVAPRSLVLNWARETEKFTGLTVFDYSTYDRELEDALQPTNPQTTEASPKLNTPRNGKGKNENSPPSCDILITTYAILRKDIAKLKDFKFSLVVLDEAQAIKNSQSLTAKSARLLRGEQRLCLTGTPVENHIGELWSIFEFLNPGFIKESKIDPKKSGGKSDKPKSPDGIVKFMISATRPFILRRAKKDVLKDLPEKTEKTVYLAMDKAQKTKYEEIKKYYAQKLALSKESAAQSKKKSKSLITNGSEAKPSKAASPLLILEGLLRLRQVSCHPGLLDKNLGANSSAKLEAATEILSDIISAGDKVLIFSQFVGFLKIFANYFKENKIEFSYLDGKTKNRQAVVDDFESSKTKQVFLISLKAGGVGLNLTSANYCFIMDPWWNPAVEAQAIDRAHRMGQKKNVFAYRFVMKDTVEEKILNLQEEKRQLASNIIEANEGLVSALTTKDLENIFQ